MAHRRSERAGHDINIASFYHGFFHFILSGPDFVLIAPNYASFNNWHWIKVFSKSSSAMNFRVMNLTKYNFCWDLLTDLLTELLNFKLELLWCLSAVLLSVHQSLQASFNLLAPFLYACVVFPIIICCHRFDVLWLMQLQFMHQCLCNFARIFLKTDISKYRHQVSYNWHADNWDWA